MIRVSLIARCVAGCGRIHLVKNLLNVNGKPHCKGCLRRMAAAQTTGRAA